MLLGMRRTGRGRGSIADIVISTTCEVVETATSTHDHGGVDALTELLREARARRRISQLDLALEIGVSQRHLSFVEVGRSRPSRELLLRWLAALEVPLAARNRALQLAGHAPAFEDAPLRAEVLAPAREALAHLLRAHDPWPALVIDARWDLVAANDGVRWLLDAVGAQVELPGVDGDGPAGPNLLDLATGVLGPAILNLPEAAAALVEQLRHEAVVEPSLRERLALVEELVPSPSRPTVPVFPPTLVTRYATRHGEIALMSMFTTFGTPHAVSLASLRAELMFPADEATRVLLAGRLR